MKVCAGGGRFSGAGTLFPWKGRLGWAMGSLFFRERGGGCLGSRGAAGLLPGLPPLKKGDPDWQCLLLFSCGGGRLWGRMFGRWEGPVFLVPGTLPPERSHSIWHYHLCLFRKRGGTSLGAPGNGRSSPGGQRRDKRVWRRRSPSPGKEGESAPTCRTEGPSLPALGPTAGDPLRGAGGCSGQTGRGDHRLFNGGRSVPAPGAAGDGKNRSANHGPGGGVPAVRPCATSSRTPFSAYPSPFSPPVQLCHQLKRVYRGVFSWRLSPSAQIFAFCIQTPCIWWHNSHSGTPPPTLRGGW